MKRIVLLLLLLMDLINLQVAAAINKLLMIELTSWDYTW